MKTKRQTFKAIDLFDEQARVIFDKKTGDIIQYDHGQKAKRPINPELMFCGIRDRTSRICRIRQFKKYPPELQKALWEEYLKGQEEPEPVPAEEPENPNQIKLEL